jgi:hypothetical protein
VTKKTIGFVNRKPLYPGRVARAAFALVLVLATLPRLYRWPPTPAETVSVL